MQFSSLNYDWLNHMLMCKLLENELSGWPSGLRRQTQGTALHCINVQCSGPRMWAWVQIPLLTYFFSFIQCLGNAGLSMEWTIKNNKILFFHRENRNNQTFDTSDCSAVC